MRSFHKIVFPLFLLFTSYFTLSQTKKIDSILVVAHNEVSDTGKIKAWNGLASLFIFVDINKAQLYADSAFIHSKKIHFPLGIAEALNSLGIVQNTLGNYGLALEIFNGSNRIYSILRNKNGIARTLSNIGIVYDMQSDYPRAMEYYKRSLALNLELKNERGIGYSYNNIGAIYHSEGNFSMALENYFKGLKARENANDATGICGSYTNIALVYFGLRDFDKALLYNEKAVELAEKFKDKLTAASLYSNIGSCYNEKAKYNFADKFFRKAIQLSVESTNPYNEIQADYSIAENFLDQLLTDSAEHYYKLSYDKSIVLDSKVDIGVSLLGLGKVAVERKDYRKALPLLERSASIAKEVNSLDFLENSLKDISLCYEFLNENEKAFTVYKKFIAVRDSIFNEAATKKNVQTEMNYQFEKKEQEAKHEQEKKEAAAQAEKKKQNIILFSISGFGLLVLGFAVFAYRNYLQKKNANEEISKQKHLIEEKQKEILDSIYYARRIQRSLLPTEKYIERVLKNY